MDSKSELDVAKKMWELRQAKSAEWGKLPLGDRQKDFSEFAKFMQAFNMVSRKILDGEYNEEAFKKYLRKQKTVGYKTKTEWVERETEYVKFLAMEMGRTYQDARDEMKKWRAQMTPPTSKPAAAPKNDEIGAKDVAKEMWEFYKTKSADKEWMERKFQEKQIDFRVEGYSDFMKKYSTVARHMIEFGEFSMPAFEKYLEKLRVTGYKDVDGWAQREADYVKYLWQAYNPRGSKNLANYYYERTRKNLVKETNSFKKDYETAKDKVTAEQAAVNRGIRRDLKEIVVSDAETRARLMLALQSLEDERKNAPPATVTSVTQPNPEDLAKAQKNQERSKRRAKKHQGLDDV